MIILTEEINLSSILLILISSSRKKKLICFQSKRNKSAFLQTALSLFSIDLEVLKNEDPYAGLSHKTFNKYELCFQKKYIEKVPLNRMASINDVVNAYSFLSSVKSAYITGTTLVVDGGYTAR